MRFTTVATSLIAFASTVLAAEPWKNIGGDLAYVGPTYNGTFKAGDTIPFEYTFFSPKIVNLNGTTNGTAPNTGTATLTSLAWLGETGNQTLQVTLDNGRASGYSATCMSTDVCTGNYYPKRIDLLIPTDVYPSNYTIILGYTLSLAGSRTIFYKEPVTIVAASANITSPKALIPNAPSVQVTLPVYTKSSGLVNQTPKTIVGATIILASLFLMI
ncbi:hypothetical protein BGZ65_007678 [Modicella reniformis]|uniref:Uncharacterized protein n=1 Tax=Modicella reniformis TaxID=1440133 RepID=A0A9P6JGQ8_9FUNG|nr:hypothetical protein BGZ65_007678 [Modicella reniformis]